MQRERVADDIYVFTSERYAQVTAGAIVTSEGAVLVDTLLYPDETRQIKQFVEGRLGCPVRYVINTHYHADHTYGTYLFPSATVIAHVRCAELLEQRGRASLAQAQAALPELAEVRLVIPHLLLKDGTFNLTLGNKTLLLWHTPGHSPDSIVCLAREDRVLFAADTVMALPHFVDGDYNDFLNSLESLKHGNFENIVQGHGEVILRGEIDEKLRSDIAYLQALRRHVEVALTKSDPHAYLRSVDIEQCGKSRVLLNGAAQQLHRDNLLALFERIRQASQPIETN
ncbi:MAG: MBL fold metallo-hydrolase [Anaerolineae bacterium]|nr:MBL fold metallo-hydrolase [Anaerolineae bacterium]MDW8299931.1 MBL fold metallo-hydrolase [Anaerolineae bacterium]